MNQYLTYIAIGVGLLFLSLLVPGLKIIAEGIIKTVFEFFVEILKNKGSFAVWFIKTLLADHVKVIQHVLQPQDDIDPTAKVRRSAEGYD